MNTVVQVTSRERLTVLWDEEKREYKAVFSGMEHSFSDKKGLEEVLLRSFDREVVGLVLHYLGDDG